MENTFDLDAKVSEIDPWQMIKKYSYSPLNISELCFLKCDFEYDDLG